MHRPATPFLALLLTLLPAIATAQSPRMMLVEEATNASCGPCAAQNPTFEQFLSSPESEHDLIPIVFHASFPGGDVMNAANAGIHNGRLSFYGISSVPTAVVNGKIPTKINGGYNGAPADIAAITETMKSARGTISPISIRVKEQRNGTASSIEVGVTSIEPLDGATLRVYAVERYHRYNSAGTNGEKDFYYVARQALPGNSGTSITLAAGESRTVSLNYEIASDWNAPEMYVVAFVQKNATKEVLQAATNRVGLEVAGDPVVAVRTGAPAAVDWNGSVHASDTVALGVTLQSATLPTGWTVAARANGQSLAKVGDHIDIPVGTSGDVAVTMTPGSLGVGRVTLRFSSPFGGSVDRTYKLYAGNADALLLKHDEGNVSIATRYEQALVGAPVATLTVDPEDEGYFDLGSYRLLIVEAGKAILDRPTIERIRGYIYGGGRLLIAGAEIAWGLADTAVAAEARDTAFLSQELHAGYAADDAGADSVFGIAGDPIGDGLRASIVNGIKNQDTPDQLTALPGAIPILRYGTSADAVAGIRYADAKRRLVYLGFGIEGIADLNGRKDLVQKSIAWLLGNEITAAVPAPRFTMAAAALRPNPTTGRFLVQLPESARDVSVRVYDPTGRMVREERGMEHRGGVEIDGTSLPSGLYSVVVEADGAVSASTVSIVR